MLRGVKLEDCVKSDLREEFNRLKPFIFETVGSKLSQAGKFVLEGNFR